jgi:ribonuclease Z
MMPMPHRLLTSLAVRLAGQVYLFDAGEGAQLGIKQAHLGLRGLGVIAVSHLHADHCLGLPGILMLRAQLAHADPLTLLGPPGLERFVSEVHARLGFHVPYPVSIREWSGAGDDCAYADDHVRIRWLPLAHSRFCLGYRVEEHTRPGKFHPEKARLLAIPEGPLWAQLQRGEAVRANAGGWCRPHEVMGPRRRGRAVAYVVDTRPCPAVLRLANGADVAFIEGMFLPGDSAHAEDKGHLTIAEAVGLARQAGSRRVVLVHLSPRYGAGALPELARVARELWPAAEIGRDLARYAVKHATGGDAEGGVPCTWEEGCR